MNQQGNMNANAQQNGKVNVNFQNHLGNLNNALQQGGNQWSPPPPQMQWGQSQRSVGQWPPQPQQRQGQSSWQTRQIQSQLNPVKPEKKGQLYYRATSSAAEERNTELLRILRVDDYHFIIYRRFEGIRDTKREMTEIHQIFDNNNFIPADDKQVAIMGNLKQCERSLDQLDNKQYGGLICGNFGLTNKDILEFDESKINDFCRFDKAISECSQGNFENYYIRMINLLKGKPQGRDTVDRIILDLTLENVRVAEIKRPGRVANKIVHKHDNIMVLYPDISRFDTYSEVEKLLVDIYDEHGEKLNNLEDSSEKERIISMIQHKELKEENSYDEFVKMKYGDLTYEEIIKNFLEDKGIKVYEVKRPGKEIYEILRIDENSNKYILYPKLSQFETDLEVQNILIEIDRQIKREGYTRLGDVKDYMEYMIIEKKVSYYGNKKENLYREFLNRKYIDGRTYGDIIHSRPYTKECIKFKEVGYKGKEINEIAKLSTSIDGYVLYPSISQFNSDSEVYGLLLTIFLETGDDDKFEKLDNVRDPQRKAKIKGMIDQYGNIGKNPRLDFYNREYKGIRYGDIIDMEHFFYLQDIKICEVKRPGKEINDVVMGIDSDKYVLYPSVDQFKSDIEVQDLLRDVEDCRDADKYEVLREIKDPERKARIKELIYKHRNNLYEKFVDRTYKDYTYWKIIVYKPYSIRVCEIHRAGKKLDRIIKVDNTYILYPRVANFKGNRLEAQKLLIDIHNYPIKRCEILDDLEDSPRKREIKSMIDKYGNEPENSYKNFLERKYNRGPTYWELIKQGIDNGMWDN